MFKHPPPAGRGNPGAPAGRGLSRGQIKSGQILKLIVWTKIGVYSIQLFSASSTLSFSSLSCLKLKKKMSLKIWVCVVLEGFWTIGVLNIDGFP